MRRRRTTVLLFALAVVSTPLFAGTGCGSTGSALAVPQEEDERDAGAAYCPRDLAAMNGARCFSEGQECVADFACQVTTELVRCTCRASRWRCRDPVGDLEVNASPRCINLGPAARDACPATMDAAQGSACTAIGRACFYEGERCASGIKKLDYCSCKGHDGSPLRYACRRVRCPEAYFEGG